MTNGQENLNDFTAITPVGRQNSRVIQRAPRILFFTEGPHPTDDEQAELDALRERMGGNVWPRNATMVSSLAFSSLEECDGVAGKVPGRYSATYPSAEAVSASILNRASDYDLPHATRTGSLYDAGNEAARSAKAPSVVQVAAGGVTQGATRELGLITQAHGGVTIPPPSAPTVPGFGSERAENPAPAAMDNPSGATTQGLGEDGRERTAASVATGKAPGDATAPFAPPPGFAPPPAASDDGIEALTRAELDSRAKDLGIEDADKLPNKAAVIAAIIEKNAD